MGIVNSRNTWNRSQHSHGMVNCRIEVLAWESIQIMSGSDEISDRKIYLSHDIRHPQVTIIIVAELKKSLYSNFHHFSYHVRFCLINLLLLEAAHNKFLASSFYPYLQCTVIVSLIVSTVCSVFFLITFLILFTVELL